MDRTAANTIGGRAIRWIRARSPRAPIALLAAALLVAAAVGPVAARPRQVSEPAMTVAIEVATRDCRAVTIRYDINWHSLSPDALSGTIALRTSPGGRSLVVQQLFLGKKGDRTSGRVRGLIVRESGYFDSQTYPNWSYQVTITYGAGLAALSNAVPIPSCEPLAPATGPAAGGTLVTVFGGGTFGGPPFTMASLVTIGGLTVSPVEVAADGSWLIFTVPPGPAGTCQFVNTDPPLPFPLPAFCYANDT